MQNEKLKKNEKSFTLLEILIVIAVIAILAAIVLVALDNAKQSAWESRGLQFSQNIRTTLATDLVGEWSFDDQSNPGRDDSGNGNNGTLTNMELPEDWTSEGKARGALKFDGINEFIDCGNKEIFHLTNAGTISAWVKPNRDYPSDTTTTIYRGIVSKTTNGTISGISYWVDWQGTNSSRNLRASISNGSSTQGFTVTNFDFKKSWTHIVYSWNGSKHSLYINGALIVPQINQTINSQQLNVSLEIGRTFRCGCYWDGLIDEVYIYNKGLTAYEIKALYAQGKMRYLSDR